MTMTKNICAIGCLALLVGCTSLTTIQSSWVDPTFEREPFERVAVLALFDTTAESRTFETNATSALAARGVTAVEAHRIVPDDEMLEEDELRAKLAQEDVDAILIYRLIAVDERNVYREADPYFRMPGGVVWNDPSYWYYYPSWNYYWHWRASRDVTRSRGYWEPHSFVVVESSLYDTEENELVWTAKSSTLDDSQFDALATSIANRVTEELAKLGAIAQPTGDRSAAAR
jgi:hypothetical protein